jgi:1-acyl-sn-glycerol-3-phosphate acyltransferase
VRLLGVSLTWSGDIPSSGLLVSNHISFIDVYAINAVVPSSFLAKHEVREWPLLGWLAGHSDNLFLKRGSRRAAQQAREQIAEHLHSGKHVAVFPEGTTSTGDGVLPFHSALFQAAIDAGTNITPIAIVYTGHDGARSYTAAYVGDTSLLQCLWSTVRADGLAVSVKLLPAHAASGMDRRHLSAHIHKAIAHSINHLR